MKLLPPDTEEAENQTENQPATEGFDQQPEDEEQQEVDQQNIQPVMTSSLTLEATREKWLVDRAILRIEELREEMGIEEDGECSINTWAWIRQRNQDSYDGDLAWRLQLGGVFEDSNLTMGTNKRYARTMASRVQDDLTGTTPFFGALAVRDGDTENQDIAKAVEATIHGKIERSNAHAAISEAQLVALIRNEAVVKASYKIQATKFVGPATVMVGGNGMPLMTPNKKLYVFQNEDWVDHPSVEGEVVLKKDPSLQMTSEELEAANFIKFDELQQTNVAYEGVDNRVLDHRDFLCPLDVETIHEADINVHIYNEQFDILGQIYRGIPVGDRYLEGDLQEHEMSGAAQAKEVHGEREGTKSQALKLISVAECYIRCDADEDGHEEEILLVLDLKRKVPIFYDYLHNHMKKRPFEAMPGIEKVPGRWYGIGVFSMMLDHGLYVDAQFNRINFKDSKEASVTFADPKATEEWNSGQPIIIGSDDVLRLRPGYGIGPGLLAPIARVNLSEVSETGVKLLEMQLQAGDLLFGVVSAQDSGVSQTNSSKLATGIVNMERTSNTYVKVTEAAHARAIEAILDQDVEMILENMDPVELVFSPDGKQLLSLNRDEIRALDRNVRLLLTRSRSSDAIAMNQQAGQVANEYWDLKEQRPARAQAMREFYINRLKGLEVTDADKVCPPVTDADIEAWKQQQAAGQQAQQRPESLSLNYKDAPDPIRRQMENRAGFIPLSPQQEAEENQKRATQKAEEAALKQKQNGPPNQATHHKSVPTEGAAA